MEQFNLLFINRNNDGCCRKWSLSVDGVNDLLAEYLNEMFWDAQSFYKEAVLKSKMIKAGDNSQQFVPGYVLINIA
ncbi:MAG: hypothetical protein MUF43_14440 [Flavobacterium sp.]|nr:hypothetical protein [Flavobacterium sp.]